MTATDAQARKSWELKKHGKIGLAAVRAGLDRKTAAKYRDLGKLPSELKKPRDWRTREDPFDEVWSLIRSKLEDAPELEAKTLFEWLEQERPNTFDPTLVFRKAYDALARQHTGRKADLEYLRMSATTTSNDAPVRAASRSRGSCKRVTSTPGRRHARAKLRPAAASSSTRRRRTSRCQFFRRTHFPIRRAPKRTTQRCGPLVGPRSQRPPSSRDQGCKASCRRLPAPSVCAFRTLRPSTKSPRNPHQRRHLDQRSSFEIDSAKS